MLFRSLQDTFLRLHTRIADADDLQINNLRSYIFRTLTNVCAKWQTGANKIKTIPLDTRIDVADTHYMGNETEYRRIARLLTEIPDEQAEVIRLRIYGDNSFAEVAEILSLTLPTVKSRFLYKRSFSKSAVFLAKQALNEDILVTKSVSKEVSISADKLFLAKADSVKSLEKTLVPFREASAQK